MFREFGVCEYGTSDVTMARMHTNSLQRGVKPLLRLDVDATNFLEFTAFAVLSGAEVLLRSSRSSYNIYTRYTLICNYCI